jgi:hypothetical protein
MIMVVATRTMITGMTITPVAAVETTTAAGMITAVEATATTTNLQVCSW